MHEQPARSDASREVSAFAFSMAATGAVQQQVSAAEARSRCLAVSSPAAGQHAAITREQQRRGILRAGRPRCDEVRVSEVMTASPSFRNVCYRSEAACSPRRCRPPTALVLEPLRSRSMHSSSHRDLALRSMTKEEAYKILRLSEGASFERVMQAKNKLLAGGGVDSDRTVQVLFGSRGGSWPWVWAVV